MPLTKVVGHTLIMNEKCNLFSSFLIEILRKLALKVAIFDSECEAVLRADAVCFGFSTADQRAAGSPNRILN